MNNTKTGSGDIAGGILIAAFFLLSIVAWGKCGHDADDPCAKIVHATVHGKAPDGAPAEIASSWCGEWKPGKAPPEEIK